MEVVMNGGAGTGDAGGQRRDEEVVVVVDSARGQKRTTGRQSVPMQLIASKGARMAAFSKRRQGLYKRAFEMSVLCGTQTAIIVFSSKGNAFSFGSPSVMNVIQRFSDATPAVQSTSDAEVDMLLQQLNALSDLAPTSGSNKKGHWWEEVPINEMNLQQLRLYYNRLAMIRSDAGNVLGQT